VFTRTLHPQFAPAMKSLWPRAYREIIDTRAKTDESAKYFQGQPERKSSGRRLDWHPDKNIFVLSNRKGLERSMGKEELKNYLAGDIIVSDSALTEKITAEELDAILEIDKALQPDIVRTVCGSTSLALDMESS